MDAAPDWWRTFFEGLSVELWRHAIPPEHTKVEADSLVEQLELGSESRVLDVPCGSGRLSLELASRGIKVVGIDISKDSIAFARASTGAELPVEFHEGDMQALAWSEEFDAAVCMGNSFGYFDDDGTRRFVVAVAAALKPGGAFVIDTPMMLPQFETKQELYEDRYVVGEMTCVSECRYDAAARRYFDANTFRSGDRVERASMSQRVWEADELRALVRACGFECVRLCADLEGSAWTSDSPTCFVLAHKP